VKRVRMLTRAYRRRLTSLVCWLGVAAGAVIMAFPIYWMFATAVRPHAEIFESAARLIPSNFSANNFRAVLTHYPVLVWVDNSVIIGVILPRAAEAFGIFMVRQFMVAIPDELIEAARLDGAGELAIFFRIVLPLSKPIIAVAVIFTFMWRWNDFAWPLVVLTDRDMFTVPLGLNLLRGEINPDWGNVMALALLSLLPMLAIFLVFQRYLIQGIASTGLK